MIVVADATPLNYLILIEALEVLEPLYDRVFVPQIVMEELGQPGAPLPVRILVAQPPVWLQVQRDPVPDPTLSFLDPGERAALALAELLQADNILIDD